MEEILINGCTFYKQPKKAIHHTAYVPREEFRGIKSVKQWHIQGKFSSNKKSGYQCFGRE